MPVNPRQQWILQTLLEKEGPVTGADLAHELSVSPRTIRADITSLSRQLAGEQIELVSTPGKGYQIPHQYHTKALELLKMFPKDEYEIPTLPEDRVLLLTRKLLLDTRPVAMEELAERLYVSRSTIAKDLEKVEEWLSSQHLQLVRKPSVGIYIKGEEIALRCAIVNCCLAFRQTDRQNDRAELEEILGPASLAALEHALHPGDSPGLQLSDRSYTNLLGYLAVSIQRIQNGHTITPDPETQHLQPGPEYTTAVEIASSIERTLDVSFTGTELVQLAKQLRQADSFTPGQPLEHTPRELDPGLYNLVDSILASVQERFKEDLSSDSELKRSLARYIDSLVHRGKFRYQRENTGLKEIGREYPHALEMAVGASKAIGNHYHIEVSEEEIGDIALYFCAALERRKADHSETVSVAFICSAGIGGSQLLRVKFERLFPEVVIKGIFPSYRIEEARRTEPDSFISTIPLEEESIPVIHVSRLLNEKDFLSIRNQLKSSGIAGRIDEPGGSDAFLGLFQPDLFEAGIDLSSREEVIRKLSEKLVDTGLVGKDFPQAVLEREELCSTAIGNSTAIPHAISSREGSHIAVGILNKPIPWGEDTVQLVFLLNLHAPDNQLKQIFYHFYDLISTTDRVRRLVRAEKYSSFIDILR